MSLAETPGLIALVFAIFLAAGTVKGLVGIGLPTASVGMMSQAMDPRAAIALVVFPSLISNAWQVWRTGGAVATVRRFWIFLLCLMGWILVISLTLTASAPTETLMLALGAVIIVFSVSSLAWAPPFLPDRWDKAGQMVSGTVSGIMGGFTAIWAPAMVPYLMSRRLEREAFISATGVMIFAGTLPLIGGYWTTGLITGPSALISIGMILPAIAGFALGERLRKRLDAEKFRRVVLIVFLLMGLNLIRRAVF